MEPSLEEARTHARFGLAAVVAVTVGCSSPAVRTVEIAREHGPEGGRPFAGRTAREVIRLVASMGLVCFVPFDLFLRRAIRIDVP